MRKPLELYIHIPFCIKKCDYCDFPSHAGSAEEQEEYVDDLLHRIEGRRGFAGKYQVETIFIGGGTPTILAEDQLQRILDKIFDVFNVSKNAEVTIEMNPKTADLSKLRLLHRLGVNRLSIGCQSTNDEELLRLGRVHTFEDFLYSYDDARNAGFDNVNVDLMSAIPGQNFDSWAASLKKIGALGPEHISAYSLIVEEGTPFYQKQKKGQLKLPDEDDERMMYKETKLILSQFGYHRYEISNYARTGYECRHNLGYWERREYLGIGYKAASLINNTRFVEDQPEEKLTRENQMEEFMFLGLRKMEGVSTKEFEKNFGEEFHRIYGRTVRELKRQELLEEKNKRVYLTDRGIDISNYVMSQFLLS